MHGILLNVHVSHPYCSSLGQSTHKYFDVLPVSQDRLRTKRRRRRRGEEKEDEEEEEEEEGEEKERRRRRRRRRRGGGEEEEKEKKKKKTTRRKGEGGGEEEVKKKKKKKKKKEVSVCFNCAFASSELVFSHLCVGQREAVRCPDFLLLCADTNTVRTSARGELTR